jgi:hypothetical protein
MTEAKRIGMRLVSRSNKLIDDMMSGRSKVSIDKVAEAMAVGAIGRRLLTGQETLDSLRRHIDGGDALHAAHHACITQQAMLAGHMRASA